MKFVIIFLLAIFTIRADVLKPALVEITFFDKQKLEITFELNLEAVISEISTKYKNTKNAPNSDKYDELRILEPDVLKSKFEEKQKEFLQNISLRVNNKELALEFKDIFVDIVGYTKRARKSIITYEAILTTIPKTLSWKYNKIYGDNAFRYRFYDRDKYTWNSWSWLVGNEKSFNKLLFEQNISQFNIFTKFIDIGFMHVIPMGFDHILFIIGMAMAPILWRYLLVLVTAFTIAHTITLGLSMKELVSLPPSIVEPLIAFSIAYIAIENILSAQSIKRKTIIVFFFGLLHGLGFASMLKTFDMDKTSFLSTLVGFNIGVELAQVLIVLSVVFVLYFIRRYTKYYRNTIVASSVAIGLIALYWTYDRIDLEQLLKLSSIS